MNHAEPPNSQNRLRAVVVDDSSASREILKRMLEREGIDVVQADSGEQAVSLVKADPDGIFLVLMDLVMEPMDGFEAIRQIRPILQDKNCAIVPMSATITDSTILRCREAGAMSPILPKPFRARDIYSLIGHLQPRGNKAHAKAADASAPATAETAKETRKSSDIDFFSALDRCGGDTELLRSLLNDFKRSAGESMQSVSQSITQRDFPTVLRQLHRLRGDAANLGLNAALEEITWLETVLQAELNSSEKKALSGSKTKAEEMAIAAYLSKASVIQQGLLNAATDLLKLPALAATAKTVESSEADGGTPQLPKLVRMLLDNDYSALTFLRTQGRILPESYTDQKEQNLRSAIEGLDFRGALDLISPRDISPELEDASATGVCRILVVDDSINAIKLLASAVRGLGTVRFASSANEALDIASRWIPDIIISDINMPEMSGVELCREIKSSATLSNCVVILASTDESISTEVEALTAGAVDFIEKPFNPTRIVARVSVQIALLRQKIASMNALGSMAAAESFGFISCDLDGIITDISPTVSRMLSLRIEQCLGMPFLQFCSPSHKITLESALEESRQSGRLGPLEVAISNKEGISIPVRIVGRQMPSQRGRILWLGIEDIRDRVIQEKLRIKEELSKVVGTMAGGIAHEFNNLLGIVIGSLDQALETNEPVRQRLLVEKANSAAVRASVISRRLNDSVSASSPSGDSLLELDDVIDRLWPMVRNAIPKQAALERVRCSESLKVRITPEELSHALIEILNNAVESSRLPPNILIRTSRITDETGNGTPHHFALLEVSDNGPGMTEQVQLRAFDPFYTTKAPPHSGLGLSEVLGFAARNGGTAELLSEQGAGTTVQIRLPVVDVTE